MLHPPRRSQGRIIPHAFIAPLHSILSLTQSFYHAAVSVSFPLLSVHPILDILCNFTPITLIFPLCRSKILEREYIFNLLTFQNYIDPIVCLPGEPTYVTLLHTVSVFFKDVRNPLLTQMTPLYVPRMFCYLL